MFTGSSEVPKIGAGNMEVCLSDLQEHFGVDVVRIHMKAWELPTSTLKAERYRDVVFRFT